VAIAGLNPIVRGVTGALDAAYSNGMAGRTGAILRGNSADNEYGWRGYLPYQRVLAIRVGATGDLRLGPSTALPATSGDVRTLGASTSVLEHLAKIAPNANYGKPA
jgi:hypothetical protein